VIKINKGRQWVQFGADQLFRQNRFFMTRLASRGLLFAVLFFAVGTSAVAEAQQADIQKITLSILDDLGIVDLVNNIPKTMQDGLVQKQQEQGIKRSDYNKKISHVVDTYFARDKILNFITTDLQSQFKVSRLTTIRRLLDSPASRELIKLKSNARSPQGIEAIKELAVQHEDSSLDKERLSLYEALDNAAADTEFYIATQALSIDSIYRINNAINKQQAAAGTDLLSSTYGLLLRPSKYTTMMSYQYMFANSSVEEIKQYTLIYRQKQMQVLLGRIMTGLSAAMQDASEKAIREIN